MKHERITTDPDIMTGKPILVGTRIPVEQVLRELAGGWTFADILDTHPRLTLADIQAVMAYAADVIANEDVILSVPADVKFDPQFRPSEDPEAMLVHMETYHDDQLWAVVYQRVAWPKKERLHELVERGKEDALTPQEQAELEALLDEVDRYTLLRSKALWLLQQRGHDVERLLTMGA